MSSFHTCSTNKNFWYFFRAHLHGRSASAAVRASYQVIQPIESEWVGIGCAQDTQEWVHRPNCTGFVSWAMHHLCIPVCVGESTQLMYTCSVYMGCSCCHKGQSAHVNELLNVTCDSKMNVSCITIYKQYCCLIVKYNTNQNIIIIIFL